MEDLQLSVEDAENRAEWRRNRVGLSYLLITSDGIAIIHYHCHLSEYSDSVGPLPKGGGGAEPARTPLNPLLTVTVL